MYVRSFVGRNNVVGIATRYWLAGRSGDRIPVVAKLSTPVRTGPGAHTDSCKVDTGLFPGVKRSGRGVDHPPPCSPEDTKTVEVYLLFPSGP
jgi:hypothetical protein